MAELEVVLVKGIGVTENVLAKAFAMKLRREIIGLRKGGLERFNSVSARRWGRVAATCPSGSDKSFAGEACTSPYRLICAYL